MTRLSDTVRNRKCNGLLIVGTPRSLSSRRVSPERLMRFPLASQQPGTSVLSHGCERSTCPPLFTSCKFPSDLRGPRLLRQPFCQHADTLSHFNTSSHAGSSIPAIYTRLPFPAPSSSSSSPSSSFRPVVMTAPLSFSRSSAAGSGRPSISTPAKKKLPLSTAKPLCDCIVWPLNHNMRHGVKA